MKIVFMGTPDFARDSLEAIYNKGYEILGVVTNVDKPKGRGMKLIPTPVKEFAIEKNLKVYQPEKVRNNQEFIQEIKNLNPDIICVVAYGKILPKEILDIPRLGCINVHGSLLPQYRGAAPIQWAVLNGDKVTGITTMYMDVGMDTGDMILKEEVQIGDNETTGELWDRLSKIGAKLLVQTIEQIENGTAPRVPQGDNFTLAPMLNKEMAKIDWNEKSAFEIKNLVRGLNPIMGAYSFLDDKKYKFWKVEVLPIKNESENISVLTIDNESNDNNFLQIENELKKSDNEFKNKINGTILKSDSKDGLYIKAKDGIIKVLEIQAENAKKMSICDFLRGNNLEVGKKFE